MRMRMSWGASSSCGEKKAPVRSTYSAQTVVVLETEIGSCPLIESAEGLTNRNASVINKWKEA